MRVHVPGSEAGRALGADPAKQWMSHGPRNGGYGESERSVTDRIYYENQADWAPSDYYSLWRYFDRLAEYVGPTPAQLQHPEHRSARISARKTGVRDEELAAIDPARMPAESRWLLRAVLVSQRRYGLALEKFPNLGALAQAVPAAVLKGYDQYPASVRATLDESRVEEEQS